MGSRRDEALIGLSFLREKHWVYISLIKKQLLRGIERGGRGRGDASMARSLLGISHSAGGLVLSLLNVRREELLMVLGLLVLLNEGAAATAAGEEDIGDAVSLEVVLFADVLALHGQRNKPETEAVDTTKKEARGVDRLIAVEVSVLAEAVMSLAEGNAGNEASHQAGVNRVEAVEETAGPAGRALMRLGVEMITGLGENSVEAGLPVIDIVLVNRATSRSTSGLGRSLRLGLGGERSGVGRDLRHFRKVI